MRPAPGIVLVLLLACGCRDRDSTTEPGPRDPNFRASVSGSLDPTLPDGRELTITARAELADPLRRSIEAALGTAMKTARPCMEGIYGTVFAEIELDGTGNVTKSVVKSPLLEGSPIAKCIEAELAKMKLGKLEGAPIEIRYPIRNMPSSEQMKEAAEIVKQAL